MFDAFLEQDVQDVDRVGIVCQMVSVEEKAQV